MFRGMYNWVLRLAHHRHATASMAAVSFAESSFFPIPPDVMLVPMILARRDKAYFIATICTIASILGGILGYFIGYALYDSVGQWLIGVYGMTDKIESFRHWYQEYGAAVILLKGLTPIPFKIVTIASGIAGFSFPLFILTATVTRAARFFLIAALLKRYGEPVQAFIEKRLDLFAWGFLALLVAGFALVTLF
ncbi:YqaA family protein [Sphingosinithalassobacter portus]|uniref:YqaA family protein n=1 Tax=Stakelama portus TaxID=2676234 RepID=UPI000C4A2960|nr:YqaA family protein [Sphingosinithalassobacter portus]MBA17989.1 cytochrome B [Sphingomonas sp.]